MFKKNFINLCAERGESPSSVCKKIGISAAAFSQWDDNTVPRKVTLQRLADYFDVSVDYLLGGEAPARPKKAAVSEDDILRDEFEKKLIKTFRETTVDGKIKIINAAEEIKAAIEKNNLSGDQRNA